MEVRLCPCGTPAQFACKGCSIAVYCGQACADADWIAGHELACIRFDIADVLHLEQITLENRAFRRVLQTTPQQQLVVMHVVKGISWELHPKATQFFRIENGSARITTWDGTAHSVIATAGDSFTVPAAIWHQVENAGVGAVSLYAIYSPATHPLGTVDIEEPSFVARPTPPLSPKLPS